MSTILAAAGSEDQHEAGWGGASTRELIVELAQTEYAIRHAPVEGAGRAAQVATLAGQERAIVAELQGRKVAVHERAVGPAPEPGSSTWDVEVVW